MKRCLALWLFVLLFAVKSNAQIITTVAGGGTSGLGDSGPATLASFTNPHFVAFDKFGNMYIGDYMGCRIRKVNTSGIISTVAGNGLSGYSGDGGLATMAKLKYPEGIVCDTLGNLYIADHDGSRIRKVDASTGIITTIAGTGVMSFTGTGDGGPAIAAQLYTPGDLVFDKKGNLYVSDNSAHTIRKINPTGIITAFAGIGYSGGFSGDGGPATSAKLYGPTQLAADDTGNIYVADAMNKRVRKIDTFGIITTVAGTGVALYSGDGIPATTANVGPLGISVFNNTLFITDSNVRVRYVDPCGIIHTIAGTGTLGFSGDGGPAIMAQIGMAGGMTNDSIGNIYFADSYNRRIRKVTALTTAASAITITATPNDTVCIGTPVTYTATVTGSPTGYQWYVNGAAVSGATASTYTYTPTDGDDIKCVIGGLSCSGAVSISSNIIRMAVIPLGVPTITLTGTTVEFAGYTVTVNAVVSGAGGSYSISWMNKGIVFATTTTPTVTYTKGFGRDSITAKCISTSTGCYDTTTSALHEVLQAMGVGSVVPLVASITPNPARDEIFVSASTEIESTTISNLLGQALLHQRGNASMQHIDISGLPSGLYVIEMRGASGNRAIAKFIKQ